MRSRTGKIHFRSELLLVLYTYLYVDLGISRMGSTSADLRSNEVPMSSGTLMNSDDRFLGLRCPELLSSADKDMDKGFVIELDVGTEEDREDRDN
jgi:hypothetical protein